MTLPITNGSRHITLTVTTSLAAALNMLLVLVVCFGVMPQVNALGDRMHAQTVAKMEAIAKLEAAVEGIHEQVDRYAKELETHKATIRRLTAILDAAEAAQLKREAERKAAEQKAKDEAAKKKDK